MKRTTFCHSTAIVAALLLSPLASADWGVVAGSTVNYVSIKNSTIAENNVFTGVTGSITDDGNIAIQIDLASVETRVDIRNQRMRELFFDVANHPVALITAQLTVPEMAQLDAGAPLERSLPLTLSLHGSEATIEAKLRAIAVGSELFVTTLEPILVSVSDYGLAAGVTALREIAGLNAIASTVPVSVNLRLVRD